MTGNAVVQEVGDRPKVSWWQVLRVLLVVGWAAWAGLAWWAAPREASVAHARADLAAGHVTSYDWGDTWRHNTGLGSQLGAELQSVGPAGPIFLWRTDDGRTHYTVLEGDSPPAGTTGAPQYSSVAAQELAAQVQAYQDRGFPAQPPTKTILAGLAIGGGLLILWALVSAPAPVTGTRWFWFWMLTGVPFGLGLLWWLARENPWSPRARPRDRRLRWYAGIGIGILSSLLIGVALWGLHDLLGDGLVPTPG